MPRLGEHFAVALAKRVTGQATPKPESKRTQSIFFTL
jgi:hypothetical protein